MDKIAETVAETEMTLDDMAQAMTDALSAIVIAVAKQVDAKKLAADLKQLADEADQHGEGKSAGLLDELVRALEQRVTKTN